MKGGTGRPGWDHIQNHRNSRGKKNNNIPWLLQLLLPSINSTTWWPFSVSANEAVRCIFILQVKLDSYLLINGGVAASRGHPHLLIEAITDGIRQVYAGVSVAS